VCCVIACEMVEIDFRYGKSRWVGGLWCDLLGFVLYCIVLYLWGKGDHVVNVSGQTSKVGRILVCKLPSFGFLCFGQGTHVTQHLHWVE
jgi:hypothetical protein